MAGWRYAGYLMGIPESVLYRDAEEAESIYTVGYLCEPPAGQDSVDMTNALVRPIPAVADITDPVEQKQTIALAYRLSRALIGPARARQFRYPWKPPFGALAVFSARQRAQKILKDTQLVRADNFAQLLKISVYDEGGLSYKMPDNTRASESSER